MPLGQQLKITWLIHLPLRGKNHIFQFISWELRYNLFQDWLIERSWRRACHEFQTWKHFIFHCTSVYDAQTPVLFNGLKALYNEIVFSVLTQNPHIALHVLLGDDGDMMVTWIFPWWHGYFHGDMDISWHWLRSHGQSEINLSTFWSPQN